MSRDDRTGALTLHVGTYTTEGRGGEGVHVLRLDAASGALALAGTAERAANPSFLAAHPSGRFLYAANEVDDYGGESTGAVSAYAVDARGGLTLLNQQASGGAHPCHVSVHGSGRCLLVANYSGGTVALLPIRDDGSLAAATDVRRHAGSGPNAKRQDAPHPHSILADPAGGGRVVAADLGIDRVLAYRLEASAGTLEPDPAADVRLAPGAGPRHVAFRPDGRFAYVVNELDSTVTALARGPSGALAPAQTLSTLPEPALPDPALPGRYDGANLPAGVLASPSGRFLYVSNRGHDTVAVFAIDGATGRLAPVQHEPTRGRWPRGLALDPSGRFLVVANERSHDLSVFRVDPDAGTLAWTGRSLQVRSPVCAVFAPA